MRGFIQRLSLSRSKFGPAPRFCAEDAVRALALLGERTGRARLAARLGVGEGTVRTVLRSVAEKNLVSSTPAGHALTARGRALMHVIRAKAVSLRPVIASRLTFGLPAHAVQLRGVGATAAPLRLRDEAVRCGASGAVFARHSGGRLFMPPFHSKTHREYSVELRGLSRRFALAEGDALLLAYGGDCVSRERALWRACALLGI